MDYQKYKLRKSSYSQATMCPSYEAQLKLNLVSLHQMQIEHLKIDWNML